eukprot:9466831-Pyramimonas_sp.AAC.1
MIDISGEDTPPPPPPEQTAEPPAPPEHPAAAAEPAEPPAAAAAEPAAPSATANQQSLQTNQQPSLEPNQQSLEPNQQPNQQQPTVGKTPNVKHVKRLLDSEPVEPRERDRARRRRFQQQLPPAAPDGLPLWQDGDINDTHRCPSRQLSWLRSQPQQRRPRALTFKLPCATSIVGGLRKKRGGKMCISALELVGVKALEASEASGSDDCRGFCFSIFCAAQRLRASTGALKLSLHRRWCIAFILSLWVLRRLWAIWCLRCPLASGGLGRLWVSRGSGCL